VTAAKRWWLREICERGPTVTPVGADFRQIPALSARDIRETDIGGDSSIRIAANQKTVGTQLDYQIRD
jgi:hypothetical protein